MTDFLKIEKVNEANGASAETSAPTKISLDFARLHDEIPDLWLRVVLIRNRVKRLSHSFDRDARRALMWFEIVTVAAATIAVSVLVTGVYVGFQRLGTGTEIAFSIAVVAAVTIAAVIASAANAFGVGRRASSMFAAKWALKALELDIDQVTHAIAIDAVDGKITAAHISKLEASIDRWLATTTVVLTSFGSNFGTAFQNLVVQEVKTPDSE